MSQEEIKLSFEEQLFKAIEERTAWYNSTVLQKVQDNYRLHLTCLNNLIGVLEKKSLITPDPYKHDTKISEIVSPPDSDFTDNERSVVLGARLSSYETMVDFVCNYFKFSVENIDLETISRLDNLNNAFAWNSLSLNSPKPNTRALAYAVSMAKSSADPLSLSLINDSVSKTNKALQEITQALRGLATFHREVYKRDIRKNILCNPSFDRTRASQTATALSTEIKRAFPSMMGKKPYYSDLIDEIIREELSPNKTDLQKKLLESLQIVVETKKKKEVVIDNHETLMEAVRTIGTLFEYYDAIIQKIKDNHELLESEHNSIFDKIAKFLRHTFGLKEPAVDYDVVIIDRTTETQKRERIHYNEFIDSLTKRSRQYASFAVRKTPGWVKISSLKDDVILDFLSKQLSENNRLMLLLSALDLFFKEATAVENKSKVKGIKMELTAVKNTLIKANQRRSEYTSYIEEQEQMKKLGITE